MLTEARAMEHVRSFGYPVPAVDEVSADGSDLVMERIDGPSMVAVLERRPWAVGRQARVLADLHAQLHEIRAPDWMQAGPAGGGDAVVHMDLHPLNVIVGASGPVVIDWTNAARGEAAADVALTWLLLATAQIPNGGPRAHLLGWFRGVFVRSFLGQVDAEEARRRLAAVVAWKVADPHMSVSERAAMGKLAVDEGA